MPASRFCIPNLNDLAVSNTEQFDCSELIGFSVRLNGPAIPCHRNELALSDDNRRLESKNRTFASIGSRRSTFSANVIAVVEPGA